MDEGFAKSSARDMRRPSVPPMTRGVHHLVLCTDDMKKTIDFYVDVLGMPLIHAMKVPGGEGTERQRLECLYVRVSGTTGQESSLDAQEAELRATATGTVARVFRDRASGLREDRPGLEKLLAAAADGQVTVVRVTHEDRLARFGAGCLSGTGCDRRW